MWEICETCGTKGELGMKNWCSLCPRKLNENEVYRKNNIKSWSLEKKLSFWIPVYCKQRNESVKEENFHKMAYERH